MQDKKPYNKQVRAHEQLDRYNADVKLIYGAKLINNTIIGYIETNYIKIYSAR